MIIALLALAFAMIVGGSFAAVLGWDIVLVERGWTMVIAGTATAASGTLLLGIAAVVSKLSRIGADLARLRGDIEGRTAFVPQAPSDISVAALSGGLAGEAALRSADVERPVEATEAVFPVSTRTETDQDKEADTGRDETRPAAPILPFKTRTEPKPAPPEPEPASAEDAADVKVPDFLLADRFRETEDEARITDADESLYAPEPTQTEAEREAGDEVAEVPAPASEREPSPVTVEPETMTEAEPRPSAIPATIVGTYNSGDNKYVMYSDGSIEAQTPNGTFHFKSLDELKEFIAAGGESSSPPST